MTYLDILSWLFFVPPVEISSGFNWGHLGSFFGGIGFFGGARGNSWVRFAEFTRSVAPRQLGRMRNAELGMRKQGVSMGGPQATSVGWLGWGGSL